MNKKGGVNSLTRCNLFCHPRVWAVVGAMFIELVGVHCTGRSWIFNNMYWIMDDDDDDKFLHLYVTGRRPAHAGVVLYDYCT